jgi:transcriptional regulator with XRE-family HTH domain
VATNPLRALRDAKRLTLEAVYKGTGVSKQYLIRLEQGTYPSVPDNILRYFDIEPGTVEYQMFAEDYYRYQLTCRHEAFETGLFTEAFPYDDYVRDTDYVQHPFTYWMSLTSTNLTDVCKRLCITQSLIHRFVKEPWVIHRLPLPLVLSLREAGWSESTIEGLETAFGEYKDALNNRVTIKVG